MMLAFALCFFVAALILAVLSAGMQLSEDPDNADDLACVALIVERACDRLSGQVEDAAHELGIACRAMDRWHDGEQP